MEKRIILTNYHHMNFIFFHHRVALWILTCHCWLHCISQVSIGLRLLVHWTCNTSLLTESCLYTWLKPSQVTFLDFFFFILLAPLVDFLTWRCYYFAHLFQHAHLIHLYFVFLALHWAPYGNPSIKVALMIANIHQLDCTLPGLHWSCLDILFKSSIFPFYSMNPRI